MKILKKYLITLGILLMILAIFMGLNVHLGHNISAKQRHISQLNRPDYITKDRVLTGNNFVPMGDLSLINDNEKSQISFSNQFLINHFSYDDATTYATNRNKSRQQMTKELWKKVQDNEFSPQTNRIGKSLISENRSTSNFISATPFLLLSTLPQDYMTQENVPIYYLVTSSYTNNSGNSSNTGKTTTLIKMQVDSKRSLVSEYQVLDKIDHS